VRVLMNSWRNITKLEQKWCSKTQGDSLDLDINKTGWALKREQILWTTIYLMIMRMSIKMIHITIIGMAIEIKIISQVLMKSSISIKTLIYYSLSIMLRAAHRTTWPIRCFQYLLSLSLKSMAWHKVLCRPT